MQRVTANPGLESRIVRSLQAFALAQDAAARDALTARLVRWTELVLEWNRRVDLTAARSDDELVDLLFADAAAIATSAPAQAAERWVDVGSGAGGPGLALALLLPSAHFTLVEPKDKRVAFLRAVVGELRMTNVTVERKRSEQVASAGFDVAVSRATLPPAEWLAEGARLATAQVWVLVARSEPPVAAGVTLAAEQNYRWPLTGAERVALRYVHMT